MVKQMIHPDTVGNCKKGKFKSLFLGTSDVLKFLKIAIAFWWTCTTYAELKKPSVHLSRWWIFVWLVNKNNIILQIKTHGCEFKKHVSDDLHPSSVSNANKTTSQCDINTMYIEY